MKHILSIQDLSCVGRCSLTVALPVISAMGHRCSVLPTAVLSTHTAFPGPEVADLTDRLEGFARHWQENGIPFDLVSVGYLSAPRQAEIVDRILEQIGSFTVLDPVMGDHGKLYSRLDDEHVFAMSELCKGADILIPNLTEAALLADMPYREQPDGAYLRALTSALLQCYNVNAVVITGVTGKDGTIGFCGADRTLGSFSYQTQVVPRQFHGTGDLFAAVLAGAVVQDRSVYDAGVLAADFVRLCVAGTDTVTPHGVAFETQLPQLFAQIYKKSC